MHVAPVPQKDLVLVGGGHAHALALRQLAMQAPSDLRISLISPDPFTPYSGMLPGLLAGHYSYAETHIDLARLCQWGGVRFFADTVVSLDLQRKRVRCKERGEVAYDLLSIDIGSQPELDSVPGAREYATAVKPVAGLWTRWQEMAQGQNELGQDVAIVGGGAGSVEIALAIAQRFSERQPSITLYCGGATILQGYAGPTRRVVEQKMAALGIAVRCLHRVVAVEENTLHFDAAPSERYGSLIWCTGAAAAPWIAESGLPSDDRGFALIEDTLQSTDHREVFAVGDIAVQHRHPRPKAGVYAVRQGPVLSANLLALLRDEPLREHRPQKRFLSMLALGPKSAVAERNGITLSGAWVWRWKDRIDRSFMRRFSELPGRKMPSTAASATSLQAPCGGCGAKVGADTLRDVLSELRVLWPRLIPADQDMDDAIPVDADGGFLQSLDALRALVDDPWQMGRIAAQHALSDIYACGAEPHSALALVTLPFAAPGLLYRDLLQCLSGALTVFASANCRLLGGHSMQGPEFQLGFAVNGALAGQARLSKRGGRDGDALILSKSLGSGAVFAAHMQTRADGRDVHRALTLMAQGNAQASRVAREHGAHALTDVTGFGLAGHLLEMLDERLCARLQLAKLRPLKGALEAMEQGIYSTLHPVNRAAAIAYCQLPDSAPLGAELLFDPQTSGGLLMALPESRAAGALESLHAQGCNAVQIGSLEYRLEGGAAIVAS